MKSVNYSDLKAFNSSLSALNSVSCADIKNTHINIGTGKDLTIKELAELIKGIIGFWGELKWDNSKPDETFRKLLDVSRNNELKWNNKICLEKGIEMIYRSYSDF